MYVNMRASSSSGKESRNAWGSGMVRGVGFQQEFTGKMS